jgi:hypothetical protein
VPVRIAICNIGRAFFLANGPSDRRHATES